VPSNSLGVLYISVIINLFFNVLAERAISADIAVLVVNAYSADKAPSEISLYLADNEFLIKLIVISWLPSNRKN
jgi:hypothetical protein